MVRRAWLGLLLAGATAGCGSGPALTPRDPGSRDPVLADDGDGRVLSTWSLDSGAFRADPPTAGSAPTVKESRAVAIALADDPHVHDTTSGHPQSKPSPLVAAYGDVTIGPEAGGGGAPSYRSRPAWIVALRTDDGPPYSCPARPAGPQPSQPPDSFGYTIFVMDAATGGDVTEYDEPGSQGCGFLSQPLAVSATPTSFP